MRWPAYARRLFVLGVAQPIMLSHPCRLQSLVTRVRRRRLARPREGKSTFAVIKRFYRIIFPASQTVVTGITDGPVIERL